MQGSAENCISCILKNRLICFGIMMEMSKVWKGLFQKNLNEIRNFVEFRTLQFWFSIITKIWKKKYILPKLHRESVIKMKFLVKIWTLEWVKLSNILKYTTSLNP